MFPAKFAKVVEPLLTGGLFALRLKKLVHSHAEIHLTAMRCFYYTAVLLCKKVQAVQNCG